MDKRLKIFVITMASLGIISLIFLATSKKQAVSPIANKKVVTNTNASNKQGTNSQNSQNSQNTAPTASGGTSSSAQQASSGILAQKADEWRQCKLGKMNQATNLAWSVQITEAIPQGGTYALGFLNGDQTLLTHVIIKQGSANFQQINSLLVAGKKVFLRGNCVDVSGDGAVVLLVF